MIMMLTCSNLVQPGLVPTASSTLEPCPILHCQLSFQKSFCSFCGSVLHGVSKLCDCNPAASNNWGRLCLVPLTLPVQSANLIRSRIGACCSISLPGPVSLTYKLLYMRKHFSHYSTGFCIEIVFLIRRICKSIEQKETHVLQH